MRYRLEKSMRIVSDLIAYCYHMGALDYHIDMRIKSDGSAYYISALAPKMTKKHLEELRETLNTPRQREIEQNYWGLSGESEIDPELVLVGMMVDEATVDLKEGVVTIAVKRLG